MSAVRMSRMRRLAATLLATLVLGAAMAAPVAAGWRIP